MREHLPIIDPKSIDGELSVVKIPAYPWNAIYTRASLRYAHAKANRRGFA
jgi:hypothetical protein